MIIKATTTNPATRFCTMAATPGERMSKATGANRGDQRRGSDPSRADDAAGAEMISERSRSQREHNRRPDGSANLAFAAWKTKASSNRNIGLRSQAGFAGAHLKWLRPLILCGQRALLLRKRDDEP
jgi:hypothetical protein